MNAIPIQSRMTKIRVCKILKHIKFISFLIPTDIFSSVTVGDIRENQFRSGSYRAKVRCTEDNHR